MLKSKCSEIEIEPNLISCCENYSIKGIPMFESKKVRNAFNNFSLKDKNKVRKLIKTLKNGSN